METVCMSRRMLVVGPEVSVEIDCAGCLDYWYGQMCMTLRMARFSGFLNPSPRRSRAARTSATIARHRDGTTRATSAEPPPSLVDPRPPRPTPSPGLQCTKRLAFTYH